MRKSGKVSIDCWFGLGGNTQFQNMMTAAFHLLLFFLSSSVVVYGKGTF